MRMKWLGILLLAGLTGCASNKVQHGGAVGAIYGAGSVYLAPVFNATPNPSAGRAITEIAATTLMAHGLPLVQNEAALAQGRAVLDEGNEASLLPVAAAAGATHALIGAVHEYRYKSDMDGSPVVSLTMRLVDTATGTTIWQGSSTKSSGYFGSLSRTAQGAVENLIEQMAGRAAPSSGHARPGQTTWNTGNHAGTAASAWNTNYQTTVPAPAVTAPRASNPTGWQEQILRRGDASAPGLTSDSGTNWPPPVTTTTPVWMPPPPPPLPAAPAVGKQPTWTLSPPPSVPVTPSAPAPAPASGGSLIPRF